MHLETIAVEAGQRVNRGEEIGTVGMTGYATGPHLHWEVNIGQTPVNPLQLTDNDLLWVAPAYVSSFIPVQP
jgi:murein DD-endopeptidase MepM/ murein hydrolase activator NlpD